jgi:hypothetical protein
LFDEDLGVAYLTAYRQSSIVRIPLEPGENVVLVGDPLDEMLVGPTSGAWGREEGHKGKRAYFLTDGGIKRLLADGILRVARVLSVEF